MFIGFYEELRFQFFSVYFICFFHFSHFFNCNENGDKFFAEIKSNLMINFMMNKNTFY